MKIIIILIASILLNIGLGVAFCRKHALPNVEPITTEIAHGESSARCVQRAVTNIITVSKAAAPFDWRAVESEDLGQGYSEEGDAGAGQLFSPMQEMTGDFLGQALSRAETGCHIVWFEALQEDHLVARGVAADQLDCAAGAAELFGQEADQSFIGGRVHRRGSDSDFQFTADGFGDFILAGSRLDFDVQEDAVGVETKIGRHRRSKGQRLERRWQPGRRVMRQDQDQDNRQDRREIHFADAQWQTPQWTEQV